MKFGSMKFSRPTLSTEMLLLLGISVIACTVNASFWRSVLAGHALTDISDLRFAAEIAVLFITLHFVLLASVATRRTVRPLLSLLLASGVLASHFIRHYGVVLDASMMRNALATNVREAAELFNADLWLSLIAALGLGALPWWIQLRPQPWRRAICIRVVAIAAAGVTALVMLWLTYQDLSALMRNERALRYQVTPLNVGWSLARVWVRNAHHAVIARDAPEPATRPVLASATRKPTVLVMVVGETARAANFSLNGYARNTNPELSQRNVVYFPNTQACGTSTEVSLPCMFSPFGRADYDEARIRRHESLLHLLARSGLRVVWLDNQSGCKGVCDGLETHDLSHAQIEGLCADDHCLDEVLLSGLQSTLSQAQTKNQGDTVVVLHQLGNHGPAYFRRYPSEMKRFTPACESQALHECSAEQIVNAYDNALLYTDRFLARTMDALQALQERFDVALVYVSDHGESLGEHGLFLHGLPYSIAPREQTEVPMLWWFGPGAALNLNVNLGCLRQKTQRPASQDQLFHSVLGLLQVQTPRYQTQRDLFYDCHTAPIPKVALQTLR